MIAKAEFITHRSTIRKDLRARTEDGQLSDLAKSMLAERLTKEWRDDDRRWNAIRADRDMWSIGLAGLEAVRWEFLHGDLQSRERCMEFLGSFDDEPSERLIEAWIEEIDECRYSWAWTSRYLRKHMNRARPKLLQILESGSPLQKYTCAIILTDTCDLEVMPVLIEILVSHLEDNDISQDRKNAMSALAGLGPRARPLLEPYLETLDLQGRWSLGHIDLRVRRHGTKAWEAWYGLSTEERIVHEWGPWTFLQRLEDAPQYLLDQMRLETNDASR